MNKAPRDYLALALDNISDPEALKRLVDSTSEHFSTYKIGLEQFTRFGPTILDSVRGNNRRIFLDLKLHDIPNTVAKAVGAAAQLGVDLLTVHTQGGSAMMKAAKEAASQAEQPLKIIGVTILTSIDEQTLRNELQVPFSPAQQAKHLASVAVASGLDGIVCSAADLPVVGEIVPENFEVVTPGIRMPGGDAHDQKRVATPESAVENGSTLLVIGRAVTAAHDPGKAAEEIAASIA